LVLKYLIIIAFFISDLSYSQLLFQHDIYQGGVTAVGFSTGQGTGSDSIYYYIEPGSTIKKAYLFSYKFKNEPFHPIYLNDQTFLYSLDDTLIMLFHSNPLVDTTYILHKDITEFISNNVGNGLKVEIPPHPFINSGAGIWGAFIYIEYENPSMPLVNTALWINQADLVGWEPNYMLELNPIDTNYPVALSLMIDRSCSVPEDGSIVRLNGDVLGLSGGDSLGLIWGEDASSINGCNGAKGHFYYQNNMLYGLDDDTANFTMNHSDALADISPYLNYNDTAYFLTTRHATPGPASPARFNVNVLYINAYTTTCNNFNVSLNVTDTAICVNEPLQLQVTGGSSYEWQPATGLSCTDCPNPIVTIDKSVTYTVKVNNTDSCSKTIPVFVKVNPLPWVDKLILRADTCGFNVGYAELAIGGEKPITYWVDTLSQTANNQFYGLEGGYRLGMATDANGCSVDTLFYLPLVNLVQAGFLASPLIGEEPVEVNFTDQSQNANNWVWYINGDTLTERSPSYLFEFADTFLITQIAYYDTPTCADTANTTIKVFKPVIVKIPNIFTPNNDLKNDEFSIQVKEADKIQWRIMNRWGQVVSLGGFDVTVQEQTITLWDGRGLNYGLPVSDGVYFYKISVQSPAYVTKEYVGSVTLVR
jgi:gliding motility-associated-like protein